uniref:LIM and SH3 domain protein 1 n=1 Tax=Crocodylus porosus TaxID=8502 RepID=A0A7M4E3H4_CROPO
LNRKGIHCTLPQAPLPNCARCGKIIYPTKKVNCLDKFWHKACFHCETCKMTLNMKNYKGYKKKLYCNAHYFGEKLRTKKKPTGAATA